MLLWKIWFDLRLRFYCSLALMLFLLAVVIGIYPMVSSAKPPTDSYAQQTLQPLGGSSLPGSRRSYMSGTNDFTKAALSACSIQYEF